MASQQAAHGNDSTSLALDASAFNGAVRPALRAEPDGPPLTVYVPPKQAPPRHPEVYQPR